MEENKVFLYSNCRYVAHEIYDLLPDELFSVVKTARKIVLKPNWVKHEHMERPGEWDYVITHPEVITAVIEKTIDYMLPGGLITIIDGPEMTTQFEKLIANYPVNEWEKKASLKNIALKVIDLREDVWIDNGELVVKRIKKIGDPIGNTDINLKEKSEFFNHKKSKKGYFGADSNIKETNDAHNGIDNRYRISRTVMEADVFINLPKLKTHKKAGVTICLKNLVGINTHRNFLPHYSIGSRTEGGDQFPVDSTKGKLESALNPLFHQYIRTNPFLSRLASPLMKIARRFFGSNKKTNRSGSWYGNDTIWRMILDLNKSLLYANPDGSFRPDEPAFRKKYIGIVDGILCGEGYGPKTPDPKPCGYIIAGSNPAAIDAVSARLMGFDPSLIPTIKNAFSINHYPIANFSLEDCFLCVDQNSFTVNQIPENLIQRFEPASGWKGNIELSVL
jgi:uncharacterized protein (DUF362 family)